MSIKKINKFLIFAGLSVTVGLLSFILNKKQEENYSTLLDYGTNNNGVVHADVIVPVYVGSGGDSGGNDSGSGDGC